MSRWPNESAARSSAFRSCSALRSTIDKSTVVAVVTVLCASGLSAVAGPTDGMTMRLTPVARHVDGCYGPIEDETCSGLGYGEDDIIGQELHVHDGGFLVYLNVQLEGWGSTGLRLRTYQAHVDAQTFGSGAGAPLELSTVPCASTADCVTTHGEKGLKCISGTCEPVWINKTRTDMVFFDRLQNDCVAAFDRNYSFLFFFAVAATNPSDTEFCSVADKGIIYYTGTLALWVPPGANGTYTIGFVEIDTFAFDDTSDPAPIEIPVTTLAAVINIIGEDCNDNDVHDETDIADGTSFDVNGNDVPDECETDCQPNGEFDFREIRSGQSKDCNDNDIPDECDILDDESDDCNTNGVPDECDISSWDSRDRDRDGVPDECQAVPAVSTWSLVILTLLMAVGLTLKFDRRFATAHRRATMYVQRRRTLSVSAAVLLTIVFGESQGVAGPTDGMTIRLTPIARTIEGCYGPVEDETCSGLGYGEDDIIGQELRVHDGGFLVYLEVQLEGWGSTGLRLRTWQAVVSQQGTLGENAAPPNPGVDLLPALVRCDSGSDCAIEHGSTGPRCFGGSCAYTWDGWRPAARTDFVFHEARKNFCLINSINEGHPLALFCSLVLPDLDPANPCSAADEGLLYYGGTLVLEVPAAAKGKYTIGFIEVDTFAFDATLDPAPIEIPVTTLAAVINVIGEDCNDNDVHDETDIADGTSFDVNGNDVPDECETDCQPNGELDFREIRSGLSKDCNDNDIPDECDILDDESDDCNTNGVPDECEIRDGRANDCDGNGIPDSCGLYCAPEQEDCEDCNGNFLPDVCDISYGHSEDRNRDGVPDECQAVPAVSTWSLVILTLLMAVGLTLKFDRPTPPFRAASVHQA